MLTRQQARELDLRAMNDYGVPGIVLMENAGRGMAELLQTLGIAGPVAVVCGKGNNGGDGLVIARHLDNVGVAVHVLLLANPEELAGDAAINYRIVQQSGLPMTRVSLDPFDETAFADLLRVDWVVDALFGVGLQGNVRSPFDRVIAAINASPAQVLAVDIPSGLDADTGQPLGCAVRAHHTATVVAHKIGFARPEASEFLGRIHCISMGAPRRLLEAFNLDERPGV
jgi:NAD(P)H-hydrate epimerase